MEELKIAIVNSTDVQGGAAVAANRLRIALNKKNVETIFFVQKQKKQSQHVYAIVNTLFDKVKYFIRSKLDEVRLPIGKNYNFTKGRIGINLHHYQLIKDANIVHIHWVHDGFLSISSIKALIRAKGKIFWTLHDMWAFTGGCHYSGECKNYQNYCHQCPVLESKIEKDLSYKNWMQKKSTLKNGIHFICPSNWMAQELKKSSLFNDFPVTVIPNCIDIELYQPQDKIESRLKLKLPFNKKILLFGAVKALSDSRKGAKYLIEALKYLSIEEYALCIYGASGQGKLNGFDTYYLGHLNNDNQLVDAYNSADVFITPSIEDNLPNTILESLSCGTPVVAFNTGGISDLIIHGETGYLSKLYSSEDLAKGIKYITSDDINFREKCRAKVIRDYSFEVIASKHIKYYLENL